MQSLTRCSMASSAKRSRVAYLLRASGARVYATYFMTPAVLSSRCASRASARSLNIFLPPQSQYSARCLDKSPTRNWLVALHQDLSIPVRERITHPDCTGWSEKEGVLFVQPPLSVLESLVAVRVHLDECGPGAGPLRVVPGSHRHGRLSDSEARHQRQTNGETECFAKRGDVLLMRPLLLHASSKATAPSRRRVLHFLFGPAQLPHALRWDNAV